MAIADFSLVHACLRDCLPDYDGVAGGYADGREEEERDGDQGHVQLPVPLLGEVDPALGPVVYKGHGHGHGHGQHWVT